MELVSLAAFFVAFVIAAALTPLARRVALALGFVDRPGAHRAHAAPMALLGGAALAVSFLITFWGVILFCFAHRDYYEASAFLSSYGSPQEVFDDGTLSRLGWVTFGGAIIFLLGLVDDRRPFPPWVKLVVPAVLAGVLAQKGVSLHFYGPVVSTVLTVLWVTAITNAFNLLDNMDGLSAGAAVISGFVFFAVTVQTRQYQVGLACAAVAGAAAGFLPYNFHPARIFLGDAGSLFLGYMLASLTVVTTFYTYRPDETILQLAMPILVLALPIFDSASVVWIRWRQGRPIFVGDRSHFSHRLVALGMSTREAVLTNYLVALAVGLGATLLIRVGAVGGAIILAQSAIILAVVVLLERAGRRRAGADRPHPPESPRSSHITDETR